MEKWRRALMTSVVIAGICLSVAGGCGRSPAPPPALTDDLKAKIQQEDQAITEAERAQAQSQP